MAIYRGSGLRCKYGITPPLYYIEYTQSSILSLRSSLAEALIKPICLPENPEFHKNILYNQTAYVAGWGRTSVDGPFSSALLDLELPILNIDECKKSYGRKAGSHIDSRNICSGHLNGGKDSCQGDSGGPLMWSNRSESKYYVVGVVSYGLKCAERGFPGIYTRVSEYIDWITSNMS